MKHIKHYFWTFFFFILSSSFLMALISYDKKDASFNTTSTQEIQNWLGTFGSYSSDFLLQFLGVSAFFLTAYIGFITLRTLLQKPLVFMKTRLVFFILFILSFSSFLSRTTENSFDFFKAGLSGFTGIYINSFFPASTLFTVLLAFLGTLFFILAFPLSFFKFHLTCLSKIHALFQRLLPKKAPKSIKVEKKTSSRRKKKTSLKREEPIRPLLKKKSFTFPSVSLLKEAKALKNAYSKEALEKAAQKLEEVFEEFGVDGKIVDFQPGPVVTLFKLEIAPGIKSSRVVGLADDIARVMSVTSVRIAVIPRTSLIGIELPNEKRQIVLLRELIDTEDYKENEKPLPLVLGKDIGGNNVFADLAAMPHLLVAGTTGSGKSVAINSMILSLLYRFSPEECRLIMIDPKMLELSVYNGIPHLMIPVVTEAPKAVMALKWAVREMEDRYRTMSGLGVRNIEGYNLKIKQTVEAGKTINRSVQTGFDPDTGKPLFETEELPLTPLPYIVIVVDEMADLMMVAGKDVEIAIQRLAQMARAAGIHLIMATQRPSVDVITGTIKSNFPTRISFQVTSKIDSRTILGEQGAEQLLGKGDMLYMAAGRRPKRVHGPFVSDDEIEKIASFWKEQGGENYISTITEEISSPSFGNASNSSDSSDKDNELYDEAVAIVLKDRKASTSYIQRQLRIGRSEE
ncbi:MAG: DNA translocase FtsK 4TM domain-containing protein, partial [Alphaproteobacteria bacterium]|nr:DNA translocase FtsK 4TM domain-containing protein [Alphaproteobacteria bacterium]